MGKGATGTKEGVASPMEPGVRKGLKRGWCLNWVPKDGEEFVRQIVRKGIPGSGNSKSQRCEIAWSLILIPKGSGSCWKILSWGMAWSTLYFRMITLAGSSVSNAAGEERPDREVRWETITVAKSRAHGHTHRTWIIGWRVVSFTKIINYYFAKSEGK